MCGSSSAGTPSIVMITCRGYSSAKSLTKSHSPSKDINRSTASLACSRMRSS